MEGILTVIRCYLINDDINTDDDSNDVSSNDDDSDDDDDEGYNIT